MERHGAIDSLARLCDEAELPYKEPDNLWECYDESKATEFLNGLVGYPAAGSSVAKKKKGARGELILIGGLIYILREIPTYLILSRYVTAPASSLKGSRQPDTILVSPYGVTNIDSKFWHRTDHPDFDKWVARDRRQIGESMEGLDNLLRPVLNKEPNSLPIIFNPTNKLDETMFPPYNDRRIHVVRSPAEVIRTIEQHGTKYTDEEMYEAKETILNLPTVAPPREYWDIESLSAYDDDNFPTMEEIEEWERESSDK